mgnify:CR=1 FL=1
MTKPRILLPPVVTSSIPLEVMQKAVLSVMTEYSETNPAPQPVDPTFAMYKPTVRGRDGSVRHPHGLYWILRYAHHIKVIIVESIPDTKECILTAVMADTSKDLDYKIRWAHEAVCLTWLKRHRLDGITLIHNGNSTVIKG